MDTSEGTPRRIAGGASPRPSRRAARAGLLLAALTPLAVLAACSDGGGRRSVPTSAPRDSVAQPQQVRPTTTLPPDDTAPVPCTVSALLVPSCGAWIGTSIPSVADRTDAARGLAEYEAVAGRTPDIIHLYKRDGEPFPTPEEAALAGRPGTARMLLFYNWKPSTTATWRQVADGAADDAIRTVAASIRAYPHTIFLSVYHEPENDLRAAPESGMTAADYVAMYRHTVELLRSEGVGNAVFVMNYMGFGGWAAVVDELWPGDDVVDWIAYDPYGHRGDLVLADLLDRPEGSWPGFYTWASRKAPTTPLMLGEWGFDTGAQAGGSSIFDGATADLESRFPRLKALVYWNSATEEYTYRLDPSTAAGAAFAAAYASFVADPYFSRTDRAGAP